MNRNMRCDRHRRAAFTLMEVMLVLAILVVLASVSVIAYRSIQERSDRNVARVQVEALEEGVNQYHIAYRRFPPSLEALWDPSQDANNTKRPATEIFLEEPAEDPWGNPYQYQVPGAKNPHGFDVWSTGPDGQETGYIGNWK